MKKNYNLAIGIIALIVIVAIVAVTGYYVSKPKEALIQGEAEATEYRISGKVPGRIEKIYFKEGEPVHKGDTLLYIDSPDVRAKLAQATAAKAAAEAQQRKAQNGAQKEQIRGAYELYQQALVQQEVLRKSFDRVQRLYDQGVITAQKYDETKAQYDAAKAQAMAAKSQWEMAAKGAREEDKQAAIALVDQANGAVMEVEGYLSELYLTAPADGIVSAVFVNEGELVGTGAPLMSVEDLSDVWFTFNIREDKLHSMQVGDPLRLSIPALDGKKVDAKVNFISVRESYATWKATKENDQYDAKTFEVRAIPSSPIQGLRPGMTCLINKDE